ncbi:MAG: hypothetical protein EWM51_09840 [Treponema sp.]|nr:MAG: hypothetical protein EWM51_09840 [Treponema sp.]
MNGAYFRKPLVQIFVCLALYAAVPVLCLGAQEESVGVSLEAALGHEATFQNLRGNALLNPGNQLDQSQAAGNFFQTLYLDTVFPGNLSFRLETRAEWFPWRDGMDTDTVGINLYGITANDSVDLETWELGYTSPGALFSCGAGKVPWLPGPAKQLKAANYFEWLFGEQGKTLAWAALTFDQASVKAVYAPRGDWVPESFADGAAGILPGESVFGLQGQAFFDSLDAGFFVSWDSDLTGGAWMSYMLGSDLLVYGEGSITSKKWMPVLDESNFAVDMTRKNGVRAMGGVLVSPSFADVSVYLEGMYTGDAYTDRDWESLSRTLATADAYLGLNAAGVRGSVLRDIRWAGMNPWSFAIHLRPNSSLFDALDWSYSIRYSLPEDLYSRLDLNFSLPGNIGLDLRWDAPFALGLDHTVRETGCFVYGQRLDIGLTFRFNAGNR